MTNKLFVAGLPYSIKDDQFAEHFASVGSVVSAKVITDRNTGQSKGFGFVEMSTEDEAKKAIESMDNTDFGGRTIIVKEARPMEPRNEGFGGGRNNNRDFRSNRDNNRNRNSDNRW